MKLELLSRDKGNQRACFEVEGVDYWFLNSMRRLMSNEVPVLAVEDIEFRKNDSALYDEILALRLGLMPLTTDLKSLSLKENCTCKGAGCGMCQVVMSLKEKGPKMVYAKHIKFKDSKVEVVHPDMPIVKLDKNQELEFEAIAVLGKGKDHAKWSPGLIYYKYYPLLKVTGKCKDACKKCSDACPLGILECKAGKVTINDKKIVDCHLCKACVEACPEGCVKLDQDETKHVLYIESWGQLSFKDMGLEATEIFENKLVELSKLIKK